MSEVALQRQLRVGSGPELVQLVLLVGDVVSVLVVGKLTVVGETLVGIVVQLFVLLGDSICNRRSGSRTPA